MINLLLACRKINGGNMNKEQGERARLVHKDFFDKCNFAIENGFYLEAMCMEYAAIEGRMTRIMMIFGFPCGLKKECDEMPDVSVNQKLGCLKNFLFDKNIFKDSYFDNAEEVKNIKKWIEKRNNIMHHLYADTEKYPSLLKESKSIAVEGLKHCRTLYDETNRLKRLISKHPEIVKYSKIKCFHEAKRNCSNLYNYLKNRER